MKSKVLFVAVALGCTTMGQAFAQGMSTTTVETGRSSGSFTTNNMSGPSTSLNTTTVYTENQGLPGSAASGNTISKTEVFESKDRGSNKTTKIKKVARKDRYNNQVDIALPHIAE